MKSEDGRPPVNPKFDKGNHMTDGNSTMLKAGTHLVNSNGSHDTVGNAVERISMTHIEVGAEVTNDSNL